MAKAVSALDLLEKDHKNVQTLFRRFQRSKDEGEQRDIMKEACNALMQHAALEEEAFYPIVREATGWDELLAEAEVEHGATRRLIEQIGRTRDREHQCALFSVLSEYTNHHIREEEERIFPLVKKSGMDLDAFGEELMVCKESLGKGGGKARKRLSGNGAGEMKRSEPRAESKGKASEPAEAASAEEDDYEEPTQEENEAFMRAREEKLSRTTLRAKWINSPDEHEDRPGQSLATRSHAVIKRWAQERSAVPATTPGADPEHPRVLRFNFPGFDKRLDEISWDAWLRTFDERELVFVFQEHMKAGNQSNFFKFDSGKPEHE
ncbi:MAG TPA: hemerythrin domain-containing protein [Burkholderiales bacterium]|nr:hemerythrin domain-containing protein [Burkholderiales bacterium]